MICKGTMAVARTIKSSSTDRRWLDGITQDSDKKVWQNRVEACDKTEEAVGEAVGEADE